ncbi:MAG: phosphopyruvate hydratase [Bacilli bacterium]
MPYIKTITALEVLDSRGNPTLKVNVETESGSKGEAIVPSGASTGMHEAKELRDNDKNRYNGKGVLKAVNNVNNVINNKLKGLDVTNQLAIDNTLKELDNTKDKSSLGANALLGVSLACARCGANYLKIPLYRYLGGINASSLPLPLMNILNGGAHASFSIDFQEIMIIPFASSFKEALRMGDEVFFALGNILKERGYSLAKGDEGGYAPLLSSNEEALKLVMDAICKASYIPGKDIFLAIDFASSEFYNPKEKIYHLKRDGKTYSSLEFVNNFISPLLTKYPLLSIEDPLSEDDWEGWTYLHDIFFNRVLIVGDDLFVTSKERLAKGIENKAANAILIKPNQIGTLSETLETIKLAQKNGLTYIISHRSGDSEDTFIADLSVATSSSFIKSGSLSRSERVSKYNRLLSIENEISSSVDNINLISDNLPFKYRK